MSGWSKAWGAFVCGLVLAGAPLAAAQGLPRERILISDDWRFTKGDPEGLAVDLRYDVRPPAESAERREADASPEEALRVARQGQNVLRAWILPSANDFIADAALRHARPPGDPGGDVAFVQDDFDDSAWARVNLPHDWAIAGPFLEEGPYGGMGRLPSWGVGWYRKDLDIPAADAGRRIVIEFEGAMSYATVWLNGRLVGGWPYGYNSFQLDLTPYVNFGGANQLAVRLDNPPDSARWYPGGGLYRDVWLIKTGPVHVRRWGVAVTTRNVSAGSAGVMVETAIANDSPASAAVEVTTELFALNADGEVDGDAVARVQPRRLRLAPGASGVASGSAQLRNPRLWGPPPTQAPNLYLAVTSVRRGGVLADRYETRFGVRDVRFDPDRGVIVNGEHIPLRGVNNHHDLGALGAAFNRRAAERQLEALREMGANAVRMSHNPPAPALLELADRMGFLVIDEVFDVWRRRKTPYDFHLIFDDWHEADLRSMIRRDRNHPSIILWSVGNEVGEQYTGEEGAALARRLVAIARDEDASRPITSALNWADADDPITAAFDVISLNYQGVGIRTLPSDFPALRARFPDRVILSSESAAALSTRGAYQFPVMGAISGPVRTGAGGDPETAEVSAYELHAADFGSSADLSFSMHAQHAYAAGEFVWTGWDYLGEPTPYYSARSSYFGIIDLAGFRKDRFYLYQAHWRPDLPLARILPHWTWPERVGQVTPVHVFTSGDEAELFVNGVSQGRRQRAPFQYRLRWDEVIYAPGELRVVAYKNGAEWAISVVRTAGAPARLDLSVDRATIAADGRDLAFITVRIADAAGNTAPRANNEIAFSIEGPGEIVATDNGDPTSFTPFASHRRAAFNGYALAIVRGAPGEAGEIRVQAVSPGLGSAVVIIQSAPGR